MQSNWNAKTGEDASKNWMGACDQYCNPETNVRVLRLLEFAGFNNLKVANTSSTRWKWHSPGEEYHNQIHYNMVKRRFQSSLNIAKIRNFPGVDIGSDHELVMMTFRLYLQRIKNQGNVRIGFSLEKLKDPNIAEFFLSNNRKKVCTTPRH